MGVASKRPPPVVYPVQRSGALGSLLAAVVLTSGAGLCLWAWQGARNATGPAGFVAGGLWLLAATGALHFWRSQFCGILRWDGQSWILDPQITATAPLVLRAPPHVLLDLQSCLWVNVQWAARGRVWLWLEQSARPERWRDLRRAVYSRARPGADNADEPAPAISRGRES